MTKEIAVRETPAFRRGVAMPFFAKIFGLACLVILTGGLPRAASAAEGAASGASSGSLSQGIAAVVNDEIISSYDLNQRIKLVFASSGIPDTQENRDRIRPQVLRNLIDERLKEQEAKRLKIEVTQDDVDRAFKRIATRSNMTVDQIGEFLKKNGVNKSTLTQQLRTDIAWNKLVGQQFGSLVSVSDGEVQEVLQRLRDESDSPSYDVSEILLTFDNPAQEAEIRNGAEKLIEQIRKGAPFQAVARQFSQSASAASGGDIGWVRASQLPAPVAEVVKNMPSGTVSDPIRTRNGYYIVQLRAMRRGSGADPLNDQYVLMRVLLPLTPDAAPRFVAQRAREAESFRASVNSCDEASRKINSYVGGKADRPRTVLAGQLEPRMRKAISGLKTGDVSQPVRSNAGVEMLVVCGYKPDEGGLPTAEQIDDNLYEQQLSMMARRHLRDLRRDAVVVKR